ncbi:hypothetical protein B0H13DRAFT_1891557 [Mycena leptocephala]|nr:hypothetical protein B0H13DRAFT_1891557 [Mycena leptocephala]
MYEICKRGRVERIQQLSERQLSTAASLPSLRWAWRCDRSKTIKGRICRVIACPLGWRDWGKLTISDGGNGRDRCNKWFTITAVEDSELVHEDTINLNGVSDKTATITMLRTCLLIRLWLPLLGLLVSYYVDDELEHYENQCPGGQYAPDFWRRYQVAI